MAKQKSAAGAIAALQAAGWTDVRASDMRKFWHLAGAYGSDQYSGHTTNPDELAAQWIEFTRAKEPPPPERKTTDAELEQERNAHPEIFSGTDSAPAAEPEPVAEEGEPLPDTLARLVPDTIEQQARKKWLHDRWLELNHKVHAPKVFGVTTAEIREHEELERYRGLFT